MDLQEIKALIDAMAVSDLSEMEVTRDDTVLRLVRKSRAQAAVTAAPAPVSAAPVRPVTPKAVVEPCVAGSAPAAAVAKTIESPLYGVLHWRPSPDAAPFVEVGQAVKAGQVVCVVEAMKVFNEILCHQDGRVAELLVASGLEVEAGQDLLRLE